MKDTTSMMADNMPPPPFKLERELTLMPSEFRERLSASTKSRKSSAARSAARRSRHERHSAASRVSKPPTENYNPRVTYINDYYNLLPHNNDNIGMYNQDFPTESRELENSSRFYAGNHQMLSIGEQENVFNQMERAYSIKTPPENNVYQAERAYSIKTPPTDMNIGDITELINDWNANESIKEKKYAVLPSIGKQTPSPTKCDITIPTSVNSHSSDHSYGNQLDYGRDRMEQEADFFADFRINTSKVQATPRQNPLPPIESKRNSKASDFMVDETNDFHEDRAGQPSHHDHSLLDVNSMNARQMSGRHKKKSFKYL